MKTKKTGFIAKWQPILKAAPHQFLTVMKAYKRVPDFLKKEHIWEGFWKYGWVSKFLVFSGFIVGLSFLFTIIDWMTDIPTETTEPMYAQMGYAVSDFGKRIYEFLFDGSAKYVILILMEVLIFHATRRTIEVLFDKRLRQPVFNDFVKAEIRMIKIVFLSIIMEALLKIPIDIVLGLFNLKFFKPFFVLLLQCYLLGFAIMDNYYEHFGFSIKESYQKMQEYLGVAIGIGLLLYLFLWIPLIGAILGTLCAAVAAAFVLKELQPELGVEDLVGEAYGTPPDLLPD